jgi:hypothetical protein
LAVDLEDQVNDAFNERLDFAQGIPGLEHDVFGRIGRSMQ